MRRILYEWLIPGEPSPQLILAAKTKALATLRQEWPEPQPVHFVDLENLGGGARGYVQAVTP